MIEGPPLKIKITKDSLINDYQVPPNQGCSCFFQSGTRTLLTDPRFIKTLEFICKHHHLSIDDIKNNDEDELYGKIHNLNGSNCDTLYDNYRNDDEFKTKCAKMLFRNLYLLGTNVEANKGGDSKNTTAFNRARYAFYMLNIFSDREDKGFSLSKQFSAQQAENVIQSWMNLEMKKITGDFNYLCSYGVAEAHAEINYDNIQNGNNFLDALTVDNFNTGDHYSKCLYKDNILPVSINSPGNNYNKKVVRINKFTPGDIVHLSDVFNAYGDEDMHIGELIVDEQGTKKKVTSENTYRDISNIYINGEKYTLIGGTIHGGNLDFGHWTAFSVNPFKDDNDGGKVTQYNDGARHSYSFDSRMGTANNSIGSLKYVKSSIVEKLKTDGECEVNIYQNAPTITAVDENKMTQIKENIIETLKEVMALRKNKLVDILKKLSSKLLRKKELVQKAKQSLATLTGGNVNKIFNKNDISNANLKNEEQKIRKSVDDIRKLVESEWSEQEVVSASLDNELESLGRQFVVDLTLDDKFKQTNYDAEVMEGKIDALYAYNIAKDLNQRFANEKGNIQRLKDFVRNNNDCKKYEKLIDEVNGKINQEETNVQSKQNIVNDLRRMEITNLKRTPQWVQAPGNRQEIFRKAEKAREFDVALRKLATEYNDILKEVKKTCDEKHITLPDNITELSDPDEGITHLDVQSRLNALKPPGGGGGGTPVVNPPPANGNANDIPESLKKIGQIYNNNKQTVTNLADKIYENKEAIEQLIATSQDWLDSAGIRNARNDNYVDFSQINDRSILDNNVLIIPGNTACETDGGTFMVSTQHVYGDETITGQERARILSNQAVVHQFQNGRIGVYTCGPQRTNCRDSQDFRSKLSDLIKSVFDNINNDINSPSGGSLIGNKNIYFGGISNATFAGSYNRDSNHTADYLNAVFVLDNLIKNDRNNSVFSRIKLSPVILQSVKNVLTDVKRYKEQEEQKSLEEEQKKKEEEEKAKREEEQKKKNEEADDQDYVWVVDKPITIDGEACKYTGPAFKSGNNYIPETSTTRKVDKNGAMVDAKKGKAIFTNREHADYEGEFKNGSVTGTGKFIWHTGNMYEGQVKNDKCHGEGKFIFNQHDFFGDVLARYVGHFCEDKVSGHGTVFYKNGDEYEGEFENNNLKDTERGRIFSRSNNVTYYGPIRASKVYPQINQNMCKPGEVTIRYGNSSAMFKGTFNESGKVTGEMIDVNGKVTKGTVTIGDDFSCKFAKEVQKEEGEDWLKDHWLKDVADKASAFFTSWWKENNKDYAIGKQFTTESGVSYSYTGPIDVSTGKPKTREDMDERYKYGRIKFSDGKRFVGKFGEDGNFAHGKLCYKDGSFDDGYLDNNCIFKPSFLSDVYMMQTSVQPRNKEEKRFNLCKSEAAALTEILVNILPYAHIIGASPKTKHLDSGYSIEMVCRLIYFEFTFEHINNALIVKCYYDCLKDKKMCDDFVLSESDPQYNDKFKQFVIFIIKKITNVLENECKKNEALTRYIQRVQNNIKEYFSTRPTINLDSTRPINLQYEIEK